MRLDAFLRDVVRKDTWQDFLVSRDLVEDERPNRRGKPSRVLVRVFPDEAPNNATKLGGVSLSTDCGVMDFFEDD